MNKNIKRGIILCSFILLTNTNNLGTAAQSDTSKTTETNSIKTKIDKRKKIKTKYTKAWVSGDYVRVRTKPSKKAKILTVYKFNTRVYRKKLKNGWSKIFYGNGYAYMHSDYLKDKKNKPKPINRFQNLIDGLSDYEKYLIYQITYLESGNQSEEGQRAVIEVILNRVLTNRYPNTVEGVLSQEGQFVTWAYKNSANPNNQQIKALQMVRDNEPILNSDYLMFSTHQFSWGRNYIQIGAHWFGTF